MVKVIEAIKPLVDNLLATAIRTKTNEGDRRPEEQLKTPVIKILEEVAGNLNQTAEVFPEPKVSNLMPDIGIKRKEEPFGFGFVELKAPQKQITPAHFVGNDRVQWRKYNATEGLNLIYTNGSEFSLIQNQEVIIKPFSIQQAGGLTELTKLLKTFFEWQATVPHERREFAIHIASHCRIIRDSVLTHLENPNSKINNLRKEWKEYLFPHTTNQEFADYYAQTLTYSTFLACLEGATKFTPYEIAGHIKDSKVLSSALDVLLTKDAEKELGIGWDLLRNSLKMLNVADLLKQGTDGENLWLYFYEDFLAAYDPELRKNAGAYYTPIEVVNFQTRMVADILETQFQKPLAFADKAVNFIDPAVGTGTYLVSAINEGIERTKDLKGEGMSEDAVNNLLANLHGFELMIGPYAVAVLRIVQTLKESLPEGQKKLTKELKIHLNDTLSNTTQKMPELGLRDTPPQILQRETKRAQEIKMEVPITVCIGNPPYDRHDAKEWKHNWVRYGEGKGKLAILNDFIHPVQKAGMGRHIKNLYNLYVYFWRWAIWKICEPTHPSYKQKLSEETLTKLNQQGGIVSFITASSYLDGPAFVGMRKHMREQFDEIYIVDLGGDGIGTRKTENVFNITTPVAIAVCVRKRNGEKIRNAKVSYIDKTTATRKEKLKWLEDARNNLSQIEWQQCPQKSAAPFLPATPNDPYFQNPKITNLLPFQHSGIQFKRTWPIGETEEVLKRRWQQFSQDTPENKKLAIPDSNHNHIETLTSQPQISPYGFRNFDRQYAFLDNRIAYTLRPDLYAKDSPSQVYMSSLLSAYLGNGIAASVSASIPDIHHYHGSWGGKDIIPLWKDSEASVPNVNETAFAKIKGQSSSPPPPRWFIFLLLRHPL